VGAFDDRRARPELLPADRGGHAARSAAENDEVELFWHILFPVAIRIDSSIQSLKWSQIRNPNHEALNNFKPSKEPIGVPG
jgi:hypothetical protein